ncbi:hypothetical protein [Lapillicoccus jejuensis]|uniref:Uncharacterized protein n=1 Tax=Lapillicoccus jejuensis TaxID=402171 RepID=A0A542E2V3_9MICO|nr:hypothetical protein [Lapillicoccus jejuensis]TQJ09661.1 hypothetical protein FB458_2774 [Lapillicoccus jejuensis]
MPSNFACLGFVRDPLHEDELFALLDRAFHLSRRLGVGLDGAHVHRWAGEDGSVLVVEVDGAGGVVGVTPSLVGRPGVRLADLRRVSVDVVTATALGPDQEPVAPLAVDLEERRFLDTHEAAADASVVALGRDVALADADAERTVHSYGVGDGVARVPQQDAGRARLTGTVLAVQERRNELTDLPYRVARVDTVLGEVDLALAVPGPEPVVGDVLTGEVYLVGSVPALLPT